MRRGIWTAVIFLFVAVLAVGCGKKDAESVVEDLNEVMNDLKSYQSAGKMILHTGQEPQEYLVEVWYQNPHYYRIALTDENRDITQIVLRNDDGVFVLTPHLKKSFRFQSDWPENQGQVYLYQSLVKSILEDNERQFSNEKDAYVFDVAANYHNGSLARQRIWIDKNNYAPQHVEVSDSEANVLVVVDFEKFVFDQPFDKDAFDMQRNLTGWNLQSLPASSPFPGEETDAEGAVSAGENRKDFGIIEPGYLPEGVQKLDIHVSNSEENPGVLLRYGGTYQFTLWESWPQELTVLSQGADVVHLGYTVGVLSGGEMKTLRWIYDGVEFQLTSDSLPEEEMIKIAESVQGQIGK